jgi:Bacterial pre-peptidase C-terminal domain.
MLRVLAVLISLSAAGWTQTCVPIATLRPVDSITGTLSDADCRLSDGSNFARYILTLPTFGQLQLSATSNDFPVNLILRDTSGRMVAGGAAIQQTVERGEYTLSVNAQSPGQLGDFSLTSAFTPEPGTLCRSISRIGPNQSIAGHLIETSCRSFHNAPYDGYLVSMLGSGTLNVTLTSPNFSGLVTVRTTDGGALDSDPLSVSVPVSGDTDYTIVVAGADPAARGDYQLAVTFTAADDETCRSQGALTASSDIHGTIGETSCRFGTDLLFHYFDLTLSDPGLADLRVQPSGDIVSLVAILDGNGRLISQDLESGGPQKPMLRQQLPPGQYTVLLISDKSGGNYTLQYRFNPGLPETCPILTLKAGAVQAGTLAGASSCRSQDAMQDVYRFSTSSPGTIDITLSSNDFNGSLLLRDAKDNNLTQNDGSADQDPHIVADVEAGWYSLAAISGDPGSYTINYKFTPHPLAACPGPQPLDLNSGFIAILGSSSCHGPDGQPVDRYQFTTPSAGTAAIFMTSTAVDSYLTLADSQGTVLRRDDNSFGGTDSLIAQWLPGQTYTFNASASGGSQTGRYRVDVAFVPGDRAAGCLPLGDLVTGTTEGSLNVSSCQYRDDTFADVYRLQVASPGNVDIEMDSDTLDTYLELLDDKGNVIDTDDDGGGGTNARLTTLVDAGTYYVVAKPFVAKGYVTGSYTLTAQ